MSYKLNPPHQNPCFEHDLLVVCKQAVIAFADNVSNTVEATTDQRMWPDNLVNFFRMYRMIEKKPIHSKYNKSPEWHKAIFVWVKHETSRTFLKSKTKRTVAPLKLKEVYD